MSVDYKSGALGYVGGVGWSLHEKGEGGLLKREVELTQKPTCNQGTIVSLKIKGDLPIPVLIQGSGMGHFVFSCIGTFSTFVDSKFVAFRWKMSLQ